MKRRSLKYAFMAAAIFIVATRVNATIYIALEIVFLTGAFLWAGKNEKHHASLFYFSCILLFSSLLLLAFDVTGFFIPSMLEALSSISKYNYDSLLSTYLSGTPDFTPPTLMAFWTRYNVFLFLFPPALHHSYKRRDALVLGVFFCAAISSLFFDRAARILDLGAALLLCDYLFSNDARKQARPISLIALLILALTFVSGMAKFLPLFLPFVILFAWMVGARSGERKMRIFMSGFLLTNALYFFVITGSPPISEAEYEGYVFLEGKNGLVLSDWGRGFAIKATSLSEPQASPANLSVFYQKVLMEEEGKAHEEMKRRGIRFVIVTDQYFKFSDGELAASDFFLEYYSGRLEELDRTLLFRMLFDDEKLSLFKKVFEKRDMAGNTIVRIFEVKATMTIKIIEKII